MAGGAVRGLAGVPSVPGVVTARGVRCAAGTDGDESVDGSWASVGGKENGGWDSPGAGVKEDLWAAPDDELREAAGSDGGAAV